MAEAPKVPGTLSNFCEAVFDNSCCNAGSPSDGAGPPKKPDGFGLFNNVDVEMEGRLNKDILAVFCLSVVCFWDDSCADRVVRGEIGCTDKTMI